MSANHEFCCDATRGEPDVREMVRWAATPVIPGTGIKAQIRNAAEALHLDYGTVRRAWYGYGGPDIYPVIYNAWLALVQRRHAAMRDSPWSFPPQPRPIRQSVAVGFRVPVAKAAKA